VVAHYARAGEASPGVIRIDLARRRSCFSAATALHLTSAALVATRRYPADASPATR
jgi:hypothetical protein